MSISGPFLFVGLSITGLGMIMLLLSFIRQEGTEREIRSTGIVFIGPIPIIISGKNKWLIVGIVTVVIVFLLLASTIEFSPKMVKPDGSMPDLWSA